MSLGILLPIAKITLGTLTCYASSSRSSFYLSDLPDARQSIALKCPTSLPSRSKNTFACYPLISSWEGAQDTPVEIWQRNTLPNSSRAWDSRHPILFRPPKLAPGEFGGSPTREFRFSARPRTARTEHPVPEPGAGLRRPRRNRRRRRPRGGDPRANGSRRCPHRPRCRW